MSDSLVGITMEEGCAQSASQLQQLQEGVYQFQIDENEEDISETNSSSEDEIDNRPSLGACLPMGQQSDDSSMIVADGFWKLRKKNDRKSSNTRISDPQKLSYCLYLLPDLTSPL